MVAPAAPVSARDEGGADYKERHQPATSQPPLPERVEACGQAPLTHDKAGAMWGEAGEELPGAGDDAAEPIELREWLVKAELHGQRLDKVLVRMAPEFSRNHLQSLVERGHVRVDAQVASVVARRVRAGQRLQVELVPTDESRAFTAQAMALDIVYEDTHLLVLNKPAGLVVHPAPGNWSGTLLNGLLAHHAAAASLPRAGIVHRLDKDTSGLMVVGKTLPCVTALTRAIAAREVHRHYLALAHGRLAFAEETIEAAIGRDPVSRIRMAVVASGKPARTDVQRLASHAGFSALACKLHSGRTHQIRVHLAWRGHPLVSDTLYGGVPGLGMQRQALHAVRLRLQHPLTGHWLDLDCLPPPDFAAAWAHVVKP
jgi:23S rRNA pseudouridine1911/1915/1917 synthase